MCFTFLLIPLFFLYTRATTITSFSNYVVNLNSKQESQDELLILISKQINEKFTDIYTLELFSFECRKTKTKLITLTDVNSAMNQSEFKANTRGWRQVRPRQDCVMPTRLTASAWRKTNWCINCVLMRVMERRERDNS